jgi:hypothetical protein
MEETATAGAEGAAAEGRAFSGTGTPADASRWRSTVLLPETGSPRERRRAWSLKVFHGDHRAPIARALTNP